LLIVVEGPDYSNHLEGVRKLPVRLNVPHQLVYSPHEYGFQRPVDASYEQFKKRVNEQWGYIAQGADATPLWLGEFGYCQHPAGCESFQAWLPFLTRYLEESHMSWAYWPLNGTQSSGQGRLYGTVEGYGLLAADYKTIAAPEVLDLLRKAGLRPE